MTPSWAGGDCHPIPLTHSPVLDIPQMNLHFLKAASGQKFRGMSRNSPTQEHNGHRPLRVHLMCAGLYLYSPHLVLSSPVRTTHHDLPFYS